MTPILFSSTETQFTSNGIGRLRDCISCLVTEERNGTYELEMEYPIGGVLFDQLVPGNVIGVIHDDDHDIQPFDIYSSSAGLETVTFYARHISYRLSNILVSPFSVDNVRSALTGIVGHVVNANPFTLSTDKAESGEFSVSYPKSARSALLGDDGSVLDVYGGEFEFDKWTVTIHSSRGADTGVTVRYGKNMVGLEQEIDGGELFNAVAPFYNNGATPIFLPEYYVQPTTPPAQPLSIRSKDFSTFFSAVPTEAELRSAAKQWIDTAKPWIPSENLHVNFIALWQTEQYKDVAAIQRVRLCDTVSVYYTQLGVIAEKQKVIRTVFDVLTERLTEIELGSPETQFVEVTDDGAGNEPVLMTSASLVTGPSQSIAAGGNYSGSFSCAKSGFRPLALLGFSTSASGVNVARMDIDPDSATIYFNMHNNGSGAANAAPAARVLYLML